MTSRRNRLVSLPRRFWYPGPAPLRILPLSLNGPHLDASGRASGIWDMRIFGPGGGSGSQSPSYSSEVNAC
jgi:hypothetical protein